MTTVAVVEDHPEYSQVLGTIINSSAEFNVVCSYTSAEKALPALVSSPVHIAIIDINLPGLSGIELIRKLKAVLPDTHCLVCSQHHDNDSLFNSLKAGASGYILKDSTPDQILNALDELVNGGAPMSPYIAKKIVTTFYTPTKPEYQHLSAREEEILRLLAKGLPYKAISDQLFISTETVKTHLRNIYGKLHVNNKIEAINLYHHRSL